MYVAMKKTLNTSKKDPEINIYTQRFLMLMKLVKINSMLQKARITYPNK